MSNYTTWCSQQSSIELVIIAVEVYLLICCAFLVVYVIDETHYLLEMMLILTGGVLNLLAGMMCLAVHGSTSGEMPIKTFVVAVTSTVCGVIMIVDFTLQIQK